MRVIVDVAWNCWEVSGSWWGICGSCLEFAGSYLELLGDARNCWQMKGAC